MLLQPEWCLAVCIMYASWIYLCLPLLSICSGARDCFLTFITGRIQIFFERLFLHYLFLTLGITVALPFLAIDSWGTSSICLLSLCNLPDTYKDRYRITEKISNETRKVVYLVLFCRSKPFYNSNEFGTTVLVR